MPVKYYQKTLLATNTPSPIDQVTKGDHIHAMLLEDNTIHEVMCQVVEAYGIFPKKAWKGYRIRTRQQVVYCTAEVPFLCEGYEAVPACQLKAGQHQLIDRMLHPVEIVSIDNGQVLCGRKWLRLDTTGSANPAAALFYQVAGLWVGDRSMESKMKTHGKLAYRTDYLFPSNVIGRTARRVMMGLMGQQEPDGQ
jgi:hypothetical protein